MKQKKWEFIYNEHVGDLSIVDENGDTILNNKFLPQSSPDGRIPYDVRDWRLIAAAPETLDAIESFVRWYDFEYEHPDNLDDWQDAMTEQMERLRTVITKSKGNQKEKINDNLQPTHP